MAAKFEEKKFNIPELKGISKKEIEEHLKLYAGYVKNVNSILDKIEEYGKDAEKNSYAILELRRHFNFEFDGMRNHEYYFSQFEGGAKTLPANSKLKNAETLLGSFDSTIAEMKTAAATMRGVGWLILYYDQTAEQLISAWSDEHHLGILTGLCPILVLDMWEHAYLFDYAPADKKKYIEAFFENLNWETVEDNYRKAGGQ